MPRKIYIRTFGCQMNSRDSEYIAGLLLDKGYTLAEAPEEAGVILFNSCSVRRHAEERVISNMGMLLKNARAAGKVYGIIGCTAQALKKDLFRRLPGLDIVCGTGEIHRLPELIKQAAHAKVLACGSVDRNIPEIPSGYRQNNNSAFVSIMRGCNNFCSYCIVPYVRGKERSRKAEDIFREIEGLIKQGIKEIMLLGQNVNSYQGRLGKKRCNFVQLLKRINDIRGLREIKFMTSHPKDATVELFKAIKQLDKVAKQLHLPLQSGSDRILGLMNRGYTAGKYAGLVRKLRTLVPQCEITTDMIVGFPGESEADFRKTYQMMKDIKFNAAYIFKYSPRPPAKAAFMQDNVSQETKQKRHKMLLDLQKKLAKKIGSVVVILSFILSFTGGEIFAQTSSLTKIETLILKDAYSQAARECQKLLAHHHQSKIQSKGHYLLGVCLLKQSRFEEARENFNLILGRYRRGEFSDDAALGIADSYFLAQDFNRAAKEYEQFIRDFPRSELTEIARRQLNLCRQGKAPVSSYFSVQLGCFANKANAERLRNKLIDAGYQAYILDSAADALYHVRIGRFSNRLEAEFLEQRLKAEGYTTKVCP